MFEVIFQDEIVTGNISIAEADTFPEAIKLVFQDFYDIFSVYNGSDLKNSSYAVFEVLHEGEVAGKYTIEES